MPIQPLARRLNSPTRGRHLCANDKIIKGQLVFCERPLVALQTVGNIHSGALVCHYCMSFCGSPSQALRIAANPNQLQEITTTSDPPLDQQSGDYALILCRHKCGQVYCCMECQQDDWEWGGHKELCTGWIDDVNHPLVQFRHHAIASNEIFLLIAKWLARILNESIPYRDNDDDMSMELHPLVDFSMKLWWEVATLSLATEPMGYADMITLDQSCRRLCDESHALLEAAWPERKGSPWLTPIGLAKLVGSLEQNCVGIRQKHPLRYNIMEDSELRHTYHNQLMKCLENAGLIGNGEDGDDCCAPSDEDNQGMQDDAGSATLPTDSIKVNGESDVASLNSKEEWDYSPDEIAEFLSNLANPMNIGSDDEWDSIFTPLDGTAHFGFTEKMNHSCEPNVVILYQARGWGRNHPLVAYCIALRDIDQDEELTISYIDADEPHEARQRALANYGFVCTCPKCQKEKDGSDEGVPSSGTTNKDGIDEDDLFGTNDTDNDSAQANDDDNECDAEEEDENDDDGLDGDAKLKQAAEQMESIWNKSKYISVPLPSLAPATNYVAQLASSLIKALDSQENDKDNNIWHLVDQCLNGVRERDFSLCRIVGPELEYQLLGSLQSKGSFTNPELREAYWCACCTAALGLAQEGTFSRSLEYLDKAIILGLDRVNLGDFFAYVEMFASQMSMTPCPHAVHCVISDFGNSELQSHVISTCLASPIQFPVPNETSYEHFQNSGESPIKWDSNPRVIRGLAKKWPATALWRNMESLSRNHGHRLVPIELGSILTEMTEELISFRSFISTYLAKSSEKNYWSLDDAINPTLQTAYLAQHPLLEQIPALYQDVDRNPCGIEPTNVNVWIGTGGTRTPLHFDSYDNLLIQLVGVKYVRLYDPNETVRLYVSRDQRYGRQGNMSEVNCELEDLKRHPLVRDATFTEVVLFPGDCLYIPSRQWHYVRALSTSISVNYWF